MLAAACLLRDPLFCLIFPTTYTFLYFPHFSILFFILLYFSVLFHTFLYTLSLALSTTFTSVSSFPHCSISPTVPFSCTVPFSTSSDCGNQATPFYLPPQHQTAVSQYSTTLGFPLFSTRISLILPGCYFDESKHEIFTQYFPPITYLLVI